MWRTDSRKGKNRSRSRKKAVTMVSERDGDDLTGVEEERSRNIQDMCDIRTNAISYGL